MDRSGCWCRIFRVLGHPSPKVWPTLEQHFHWADNTGNIRLRRPDAGSTTLHEVPCALLSISAPLCSAGQQNTSAAARAPETFRARLQHVRASAHGHALPPGCATMDLLSQLLTYDPVRRCTAQVALRHPYFLEVTDRTISMYPASVLAQNAGCRAVRCRAVRKRRQRSSSKLSRSQHCIAGAAAGPERLPAQGAGDALPAPRTRHRWCAA
jgi:hypothetical protein